MILGLTPDSEALLRRIVAVGKIPPDGLNSTAPAYPPAGAGGRDPAIAKIVEKWLPPDAKKLRLFSGQEPPPGVVAEWDGIVHCGGIHHREQMGLLCRARRLLKDGGRLILSGEYLRGVNEVCQSPLPTEFSLLQLAERLGFRLLESTDWSSHAKSRVELAQNHAGGGGVGAPSISPRAEPPVSETRHGSRILARLRGAWSKWFRARSKTPQSGERATPLEALTKELNALAAEFATGRRRFECFVFELDRGSGGPWSDLELGDIDSFEPEEVAKIFEDSFDVKFDPALWRWKYGGGRGSCIVARSGPGAPVVAHYGGAAREVDCFGADLLAFQGCDVMVKPALRRRYGRGSLYFHMTATLFEREIGYTTKHALGFGFPNKPVMKTAVRLGLYGKVDDYVQLAFAAGDPAAGPNPAVEALDLGKSAHAEAADALWSAMREDFRQAVIGKRHADYLRYRYFQHPRAADYRPLLLRRGRDIFAVVVFKRHEEQWLLMDAVAPLAEMDATLRRASSWAATENGGALRMWLTQAWVERLGWQNRVEKNLGIEIPFNAWNPGPDSTLPYGAWWLTAGDMDFL